MYKAGVPEWNLQLNLTRHILIRLAYLCLSTLSTLQLTEFRQHIVSSKMTFEALISIFIDIVCERKSE